MSAVDTLLDAVIDREGGYTNNAADRGGPTCWGITETVARANGYKGDMRYLPRETAMAIYRIKYVERPGYDKLIAFSVPVAFELIDTYINMGGGSKDALDGPSYWLQRWLNAFNRQQADYPDVIVDGDIGGKTVLALDTFLRKRGKLGERVLVAALNCSQGARYLRITEGNPSQEAFTFGWLANRVL